MSLLVSQSLLKKAEMRLANPVPIVSALERNTSEGWRWGYYINAIFSFASLIGLFIAYHPPTYHQLHNHPVDDPPVKDWLGLSIFTTAIAMVTYSLGWGKFIWG